MGTKSSAAKKYRLSSVGESFSADGQAPEPDAIETSGAPAIDGEIIPVAVTKLGRGRSFEKGRSGNPKGRPIGSRNKATLALELLFEGGAEAVGAKAQELANAGNERMIQFILSRLLPPKREENAFIEIPRLTSPTACREAKARVAEAAAAGEISSTEAARQISNIAAVERNFEYQYLEQERLFEVRLAEVENTRLCAKYPHCEDADEGVRRFKAFYRELRKLKFSEAVSEILLWEYFETLTPAAQELYDAEFPQDDSNNENSDPEPVNGGE